MDLHRPLSALLAVVYLAAAYVETGPGAVWLLCIPPAVLVWEAETAAEYTGNLGLTPIPSVVARRSRPRRRVGVPARTPRRLGSKPPAATRAIAMLRQDARGPARALGA